MATIVVSGSLANKCFNGGAAWTRLSWVLGLKRLGFKVYFAEQISRQACVDDTGAVVPFDRSLNVGFFKKVIEQFGLSGSAALICDDGQQSVGLSYAELLDVAETAELLINISGHLTLEALTRRLRLKVYIDLDPGFTQFWHAAGYTGTRLAGHAFYFTVGVNIGGPDCAIPSGDIRWRPLAPPLPVEHWPPSSEGDSNRFTTIATWRGPYGPIHHAGRVYGSKVHEFRKFIELPERAPQRFEIALQIHPADGKDLAALRQHRWQIVDPATAVPDPLTFRRYVQESGGEFSVAQGMYVGTQSGWFSDRTVRYLASGKPALVQDTGFSRIYPADEGLVAFRTLAEAVAGADRIARDYQKHCRTARAIAEAYFDSDKVLGRLVEDVGVAP